MVGSELQSLQLGDPLLDEYLAFVGIGPLAFDADEEIATLAGAGRDKGDAHLPCLPAVSLET